MIPGNVLLGGSIVLGFFAFDDPMLKVALALGFFVFIVIDGERSRPWSR